ncbi:WYL domain-containing protein [Henriciella algicola]|uniref:WYL domain-containing protein n=1 Tax=Henriciella algicola TaxID=1608422 RepID=A0A399RE29_9PROT|nr:WYL domain-containing protein [Henriciella algicola]RIJ27789.1 WYL domain-containing protein [Henriciella algicola]
MTLDNLKHAQRQRLLFLDRCFTWRGVGRRRDLTDRFGISTAQAANDFRAYLSLVEDAPEYDAQLKAYVAKRHHRPLAPSSMQDVFEVLDTSSEDELPAALPRANRWLDTHVAIALHDAISNKRKIKISYTSMSSGETAPQWIAPTRFTFDGETIHFRAYSFKRGEFRNFHPSRIEPKIDYPTGEIKAPLPFDLEWHTLSVIWLRPSVYLSSAQAAVVRREYGFSDDLLKVEVRKALEFYIDRRWGLNEPGARLEKVKTELVWPEDNGTLSTRS